MKSNHNDEKSTKHLKEVIDSLKKQNLKFKIEIKNLKDIINKLQEEKMDLSRRLMEMEGEVVLYKDNNNINDEMLYIPKKSSRFSTISQRESFHKISQASSREIKILPSMKISSNNNFSIISKINLTSEINILKDELNKKNKIISDLEKSGKKKNITDIFSRNFPMKKESNSKEINDSLFEENESHIYLENNIYKEIENILEEKRNFVIQTLTRENFSFDILKEKQKEKDKDINSKIDTNKINIEQILELIKQRKKKVEITKKYLEEKIS